MPYTNYINDKQMVDVFSGKSLEEDYDDMIECVTFFSEEEFEEEMNKIDEAEIILLEEELCE
jgi:hypothetical protein